MNKITYLEEIAREYRAYIALTHPADDLASVRSAMQGLEDGTVLRIIKEEGEPYEKDAD